MKVVIFGSTGYIGKEFCRQMFEKNINYVALPSRGWTSVVSLENVVMSYNPTTIVNCAAYVGTTSIEDCENNKSDTILSNVLFVQLLKNICENNDLILGHFSTGCLYDGHMTRAFTEDEQPILCFANNNCSFYTGTKVLAENILEHMVNKYIWRIRLPFDNIHNNRNYLSKLINYDRLVSAPNSLSHKEDTVSACIQCLTLGVPFGTYHVTNPGYVTARDITMEMTYRIPGLKREFKFFDRVSDYQKTRRIPTSNTVLSVEKLLKTGVQIRTIDEALIDTLNKWSWT